MQDCSNFSVLPMELLQSCAKPSIYDCIIMIHNYTIRRILYVVPGVSSQLRFSLAATQLHCQLYTIVLPSCIVFSDAIMIGHQTVDWGFWNIHLANSEIGFRPYKGKSRLEQLECLCSEDTPATPRLTILLTSSYWIPSQNNTVKVTILKNLQKLQIF